VVHRDPERWPGDPRHPVRSAESCWLPPLTRFTNDRRAGPDHRSGPRRTQATAKPIGGGPVVSPRLLVQEVHLEECESGRIGTTGNRVWGNPPWVQIPPPPPRPLFSPRESGVSDKWSAALGPDPGPTWSPLRPVSTESGRRDSRGPSSESSVATIEAGPTVSTAAGLETEATNSVSRYCRRERRC
jgi:hypothetical protein